MARLLLQLVALQLVLFVAVSGLFKSKKIQGTKYKLQQKVLTLGSSYTIKDEKDKPVYKVSFDLFLLRYTSFVGWIQTIRLR